MAKKAKQKLSEFEKELLNTLLGITRVADGNPRAGRLLLRQYVKMLKEAAVYLRNVAKRCDRLHVWAINYGNSQNPTRAVKSKKNRVPFGLSQKANARSKRRPQADA